MARAPYRIGPVQEDAIVSAVEEWGRSPKIMAAAVGPNDQGRACSVSTIADHIERNPEFGDRVEAAEGEFQRKVRAEMVRRAIEGVDEPVFQGGKHIGDVRKYDTPLLIRLAKLDPDFKDRIQVDQKVTHSGIPQMHELPEAVRRLLEEAAALDVPTKIPGVVGTLPALTVDDPDAEDDEGEGS